MRFIGFPVLRFGQRHFADVEMVALLDEQRGRVGDAELARQAPI
jgi:DNA topoisomerase IB